MVRTQPFPLQWGLMKVMNFKFNLNKKSYWMLQLVLLYHIVNLSINNAYFKIVKSSNDKSPLKTILTLILANTTHVWINKSLHVPPTPHSSSVSIIPNIV